MSLPLPARAALAGGQQQQLPKPGLGRLLVVNVGTGRFIPACCK
jgi:hypothetical protein